MNTQLTERGNKWAVAFLKRTVHDKQASTPKVLKKVKATLGKIAQRKNNDSPALWWALASYLISLKVIEVIHFGFVSHNENVYASASQIASVTIGYMLCALISIVVLVAHILNSNNKPSLSVKLSAVIYFLCMVFYFAIAIDGLVNLEQWTAFDFISTLLFGYSHWVVPLGVTDIVLLAVGAYASLPHCWGFIVNGRWYTD